MQLMMCLSAREHSVRASIISEFLRSKPTEIGKESYGAITFAILGVIQVGVGDRLYNGALSWKRAHMEALQPHPRRDL